MKCKKIQKSIAKNYIYDIIDLTNIGKEVENLKYIGKLDIEKIGEYKDIITTTDVVLTNERKQHIYEEHTKDFDIIITNIDKVVLNPSEVLKDLKNKDTILMIDKLDESNLNVVVKLNTVDNKEHPKNSVMTAWLIRDKNLRKLRLKAETLYKKE